MKLDLHSHSTVSDGLDSPAALVGRMADAGIDCLALTDHDTLQGLPEARDEARRRGIELISGAEISAEWGGQDDIHILALFVDETNAALQAQLSTRQEERRTRGRADGEEARRARVRDRPRGHPGGRRRRRLGTAASGPGPDPGGLCGQQRRGLRPLPRPRAPLVRGVREVEGRRGRARGACRRRRDVARARGLVQEHRRADPGSRRGRPRRDRSLPSRSRARRGAALRRARPRARRWRRRRAATSTARSRGASGRAACSATRRCSTRCARDGRRRAPAVIPSVVRFALASDQSSYSAARDSRPGSTRIESICRKLARDDVRKDFVLSDIICLTAALMMLWKTRATCRNLWSR